MSNNIVKHQDMHDICNALWTKVKEQVKDRPFLHQDNVYTKKNEFQNFSPRVTKDFALVGHGSRLTNLTEHSGNIYVCGLDYSIRTSLDITHLLIPIANAQVGDTINIAYFAVNADSNTVVSTPNDITCNIVETKYMGYYCARVPLSGSNVYTHSVGFGFRVTEKTIGGRNLKMVASNAGASWSDTSAPGVGAGLVNAINYTFPYIVGYHTTSEVVTRFDIDHNTPFVSTFAIGARAYMIGELKEFAYDMGATFSEDGTLWLRCEGQEITRADYPELYDRMPQTQDGKVVLPGGQSTNYKYICAQ